MIADTVRSASLLGATLTMGLTAGTFALYAHTIMPALRGTDDRAFVGAFQALDRAIINPWFMGGGFVGALLLTATAAATNLHRPALPWIGAALALYVVAVVITLAVNVPLNDAIKAVGDSERIGDPAQVRARFHEARWAAYNLVRTVATLGAFGCLTWSLVLHGRASR